MTNSVTTIVVQGADGRQGEAELSQRQLTALAQFIKRVGWAEFRANAVDDEEAHAVKDAVIALQDALAHVGFPPA